MNFSFSDETLIRGYLLGTLPEEKLEEMNEKLLSDADFVQLVELVEDEIIEDYLDGTLAGEDREAVETYFLRVPERQDKMRFARLLSLQSKKAEASRGLAVLPRPPRPARFAWRISAAIAALLFLAVSTPLAIYTARLQGEIKSITAKLDQAHRDNAELSKKVEALQAQVNAGQTGTPDSLVAVVKPQPMVRSTGSGQTKPTPQPKLTSATKSLEIRIPLFDAVSPTYHVELLDAANKKLWSSKDGIAPVKIGHLNMLQFRIDSPGTLLAPGEYRVAITGSSSTHGKEFEFEILK